MQILIQPDSLSMVGSMNPFEIYTTKEVTFVLKDKATGSIVVQHTYTPNEDHRITLKVKDIILPLLSFKVSDSSLPYEQPNIMKAYEAVLTEKGESQSITVEFSVLRAGVDQLADSAANFLKTNFLTWQPTAKAVTYYSPEFLTYYAQDNCTLKCKASMWNGTGYDVQELTLASLAAGKVWTIPVQYAIIANQVTGDVLPSYYGIWVEDADGTRLTYEQRYYASDQKSEEEEWFLFENSLGGIDCFRAYGNSENTAEYTHNVAEIEEDSEEYRVDTDRKFKKNTGFLDKNERLWLLDFFPSLGKYHYSSNSLRKITVTDSDVNYEAKELPSNYTFTYKYSDARPYLNLKRTDAELKEMEIHIPDLGNFTIAPRLVEFPRQSLSDGALFPVQNPYSEEWGATTMASICQHIAASLTEGYKGGGGIGHTHNNIDLLNALSEFAGYILYNGEKLKAGLADEADDFSENGKASKKILRKDIADIAQELITFLKGAAFGNFTPGITTGSGARIDERGNGEFESITSRSSITTKELIVNRQTAMESNFVFTESGLVESVKEIPSTAGDNTIYKLKLQKRWENDFTAFKENDVILASINSLMADGKFYDMWFRVLSVNTVSNTIDVVCYPDDEVPSGKNYPPTELARLIRWGNATNEGRQSCWYISSSDGLLVWLDHVMKPIIDKTNYSVALGKLPDALQFVFKDFPTANKRDGAFYAKWMVASSFQTIDYQGNPIITTRVRGQWSLEVAKGNDPYRNGDNTVDSVYYLGCKWRCLKDKTTSPPTYSSTDWAFEEGNPYFQLEMLSSNNWHFRSAQIMQRDSDHNFVPFTTLYLKGWLYNQDVTSSMVNIVWTRNTGNPSKDNEWAQAHAESGLSIALTYDDLGNSDYIMGTVTFKATAEIRDGETLLTDFDTVKI